MNRTDKMMATRKANKEKTIALSETIGKEVRDIKKRNGKVIHQDIFLLANKYGLTVKVMYKLLEQLKVIMEGTY